MRSNTLRALGLGLVFCVAKGIAAPVPAGELSRVDAEKRFKVIRNVHYDLSLDATPKDTFHGTVTLRFEHILKKKNAPVRIDFREGTIKKIVLNQKEIPSTAFQYDGNALWIQGVPAGNVQIDVSFSHAYSKTGDGFYRFVDPEDQRVYVYTDSEPYNANLIFPLFDQPDLKATYQLTLLAPQEWIVTSADLPARVTKKGEQKEWIFPRVGPFSSYVFSITGGEFQVWSDSHRGMPLRVLARKSLARWVHPQDWFHAVKKGIDFYEGFFSTPYPYKKYDQVIVPDFNAGAMENVANVTFSERYIQRRTPTVREKSRMYSTILHELAHMWFGDLVTMKWWNGLWLNESFATFMAYLALEQFSEIPNPWINFTGTTKQWAYWQDELVTTHPIEVPVSNTGEAFTNFDGITYGKGASVLRQLYHYVGETSFKKGMAIYFKKFAEKNSEIQDFLGSIEEASNLDLKTWANLWLKTSQVNHVSVDYACENDSITSASLRQSYPKGYPTLRPHKSILALVYPGKKMRYEIVESIPIQYDKAMTPLPMLQGKACPAFIFPNRQDYDYVKVHLRSKDLDFLKVHLTQIDDDFLRAMLWQVLWDSVEDGALSLNEYVALLQNHLPKEKVGQIIEDQQKQLFSQVIYYLEAKNKSDLIGQLADFFLAQWKIASSSDIRQLYSDLFIAYANRDDHRKVLHQMLSKKSFNHVAIDQDKRWTIVHKLASMGDPSALARAKKEASLDRSSRGQENGLIANVLVPDVETKRKYLREVYDSPRKLSEKKAIAKALLPTSQQQLWPALQNDITQLYRKHYTLDEPRLHQAYISESFGRTCDPKNIRLSDEMRRWTASETTVRAWAVRKQELEKCARILANLQ